MFYYFEESKVLQLFKNLNKYGNIEIVFDTVNSSGMKRMYKYMKQVGHADASMYFYVDSAEKMADKVNVTVLKEDTYYCHTDKKGLQFMTSTFMKVSDKFKMVKMLHIGLNK